MNTADPLQNFLATLTDGLSDASFVKVSLVHYTGPDETLKTIIVKKILIKRQEKLSFTYRHKNRDIVKNYDFDEAIGRIAEALQSDFHAATLCTTAFDLVFETDKSGQQRLRKSPPSQTAPASLEHDRQKKRMIGPTKSYLHDLGITDAAGAVVKASQDKYRQINKFVEIISGLIADISPKKVNRVVDMGSGKGYLTFALYDYMTEAFDFVPQITGVEYREDMVHLCNKISKTHNFSGLDFVRGTIEDHDASGVDLLIALHACDTATDDAIAKGIKEGASLIVVAPCCHKQVRREIEAGKIKNDLEFLTDYGIFMERQAEMVTDGLRALYLNYHGYTTKVFEFISDAHTPKNIMIVARKISDKKDPKILEKIKATKTYFGINAHALDSRLEI